MKSMIIAATASVLVTAPLMAQEDNTLVPIQPVKSQDQVPGVHGRLAASGIGLVRRELPGPLWLDGRVGYVLSVCTDEAFRGRGYATAIMSSLLEWFRGEGIRKVDLHASPFGIEIYRRLGFVEPVNPELSWRDPAPESLR